MATCFLSPYLYDNHPPLESLGSIAVRAVFSRVLIYYVSPPAPVFPHGTRPDHFAWEIALVLLCLLSGLKTPPPSRNGALWPLTWTSARFFVDFYREVFFFAAVFGLWGGF